MVVPKLDLAPVVVAQRQQNLDENLTLAAEGLNVKDRKHISDKLGLVTVKRALKAVMKADAKSADEESYRNVEVQQVEDESIVIVNTGQQSSHVSDPYKWFSSEQKSSVNYK